MSDKRYVLMDQDQSNIIASGLNYKDARFMKLADERQKRCVDIYRKLGRIPDIEDTDETKYMVTIINVSPHTKKTSSVMFREKYDLAKAKKTKKHFEDLGFIVEITQCME